jgi:hypothetical protein
MQIGIVGGLDSAGPALSRLAAAAGHELLLHDGSMSSCGARALERLVDRADLVLVLTDVNSHGAVRHARKLLRERGRWPLLLRRCGSVRFASLLASLERREELAHGRGDPGASRATRPMPPTASGACDA